MLSQCQSILSEVHIDAADSNWDSTHPHSFFSLETRTENTAMRRAKKDYTLNPFDISNLSLQLLTFLPMHASRPGNDYR